MSEIEQRVDGLMAAGQPAEALKILTLALRESECGELWNDWASAACVCGDPNLAEQGFRRALQLDHSHRQAAVNLATLLLGQRRFDESIPVLESLLGRLTVGERRALQELTASAKTPAEPPSAPTSVMTSEPSNTVLPTASPAVSTRVRVVIVSPEGYVHSEAFAEVAETLCLGLRGVGLDAEVVSNRFDPAAVNLVLGWHLLSDQALPPRCILYNLEQLDEKNQVLRSRLTNLADRCEVWDYSQRNIRILHQGGFPAAIRHVPIGTMPSLSRISSAPQQDIDVLFYGSINARRARVIEALKAAGLEVKAVFGVYGAARDALIARAKVILNLHFYDASIFEMVRTSYLWINRKAVVAECHNATEIEEDLKEAASFVPYDQLVGACQRLVADAALRKGLERRAFEIMSKRDEVAILRNVLEGKAATPAAQNQPPAVTELSRLALETPIPAQASAPVQQANLRIGKIAPSLPERQHLLVECRAPVSAQTLPAQQHQLQIGRTRKGPSSEKNIQLFAPAFDVDACLAEIRVCLERGWTGIGFKTVEFENQFSEYLEAPYCHFVNANTNGIHLLLEMLKATRKWQSGDEVISSGMTFVSANHSILHAGLTPVFADVDSSLCITVAEIEKKITSKTRAVMFVGIGGNAGELTEISKFCRSRGILLILDAAHCAGSRLHARHLAYYADYSIFSFQAVKNLPTADAGLITIQTEEENQLVRQLSWCGINKDTFSRSRDGYQWMYSVSDVGYKYHGNSIMAAIAIAQLKSLDIGNSRRRELAGLYSRKLNGVGGIRYIPHSNEAESSRHLIQFIAPRRNELIEYLKSRGVGAGVHYRCNSRYPMYAQNHLPLSEELDGKIISLPCHLRMSDEDTDYVVDCITDFYGDK